MELDQKKFHSLLKSAGNAARTVLGAVFGSRKPADRVLGAWFRENRRCGSRDRRFISESIYALLRNWGLLRRFLPADRLAEIESGAIRLGRTELDALLFGALYLDARDLPAAHMLADELHLPWPKTLPAADPLEGRAAALAKLYGVPVECRLADLVPK